MTERMHKELSEFCHGSEGPGWLFPSRTSSAMVGHLNSIRNSFKDACARGGLDSKLVPYLARHTFGTTALRETGNTFAVMKAKRGISAIQLDNQGVYYGARLPNTFVPPPDGSNPPLNVVQGQRCGVWTTLQPYDDRVPVPTRITVDTSRSVVPFTTPDGSIQYSVPLSSGLTLPIPSSLTFWMAGASVPGNINILVTGIPFPTSAWQKNRVATSETVSYTSTEGAQTTTTVWSSISSIMVRGVPAGVTISCSHMPFTLPAVADLQRPYTDPRFRDQTFGRYWNINGPWLTESYHGGPSVELSTVNSYATPDVLLDIAIDPNAYTMLACSATKLYTLDRRALMPGSLNVTAITADPVYSVNVVYDETTLSTAARYVRFQPLAHASNTTIGSFRYVVEDPNGNAFCVDATGSFITYAGGAAWSLGVPTEVSIPLTLIGTYVVTLQCIDITGNITSDSFPYPNLGLNVVSTLDLTAIVPKAQGVARDSLQRLWIWTGDYAIPVQLHYDAYLYDSDSQSIFLTDPFDQVSVA